jgi:ABC-type multidrug transport system permease subunit
MVEVDVSSFPLHLSYSSFAGSRYVAYIRVEKGINISIVIGRQPINCADKELVTLEPPSGQTCGGYMAQYITNRGGYLTNSDATSHCRFCSSRTTDQWMGPSFNIFYDHHWRDFGFFCAYIIFNVSYLRIIHLIVLFHGRWC